VAEYGLRIIVVRIKGATFAFSLPINLVIKAMKISRKG
jgi:hypothetical protein